MKKKLQKAAIFNTFIALFIAATGMILISSCGSTSVTEQEAYDAGSTIRRMITGE